MYAVNSSNVLRTGGPKDIVLAVEMRIRYHPKNEDVYRLT
jgi:hypothetical protein